MFTYDDIEEKNLMFAQTVIKLTSQSKTSGFTREITQVIYY